MSKTKVFADNGWWMLRAMWISSIILVSAMVGVLGGYYKGFDRGWEARAIVTEAELIKEGALRTAGHFTVTGWERIKCQYTKYPNMVLLTWRKNDDKRSGKTETDNSK